MTAESRSQPHYTAAAALARLQSGNLRFGNGETHFPTTRKGVLADLAKGQQPYATILGCSDELGSGRVRFLD